MIRKDEPNEVSISETTTTADRAKPPRQPGALKGQIQIADDFDELPEDIPEAFGLR